MLGLKLNHVSKSGPWAQPGLTFNMWPYYGSGVSRKIIQSWSSLVLCIPRTIFWPKLAAIFDFDVFYMWRIFNLYHRICHPQNHISRGELCISVIIRCWDTEISIFSFSAFSSGQPFWKCARRRSASSKFHLNITDSHYWALCDQKNICSFI